jgi:hypothetical protein
MAMDAFFNQYNTHHETESLLSVPYSANVRKTNRSTLGHCSKNEHDNFNMFFHQLNNMFQFRYIGIFFTVVLQRYYDKKLGLE